MQTKNRKSGIMCRLKETGRQACAAIEQRVHSNKFLSIRQ